jgi:hypothetical protein
LHDYAIAFSLFMTNDFCEIESGSEEKRVKSEEFATAPDSLQPVAVANSSLFTLHSSLLTLHSSLITLHSSLLTP